MTQPPKTILLIEDCHGDVRLLREMLIDEGAFDETTHVESMREAEKLLRSRSFEIVLLDLGLSDARGLGAVRRTHAAAPATPLVVLTGMDDDVLATQALHEGAQDFLIKGQFDARGLRRAMQYAIARKNTEDALFAEKERAQVTLDCIADAVISTDVAGNITFLNLVAQQLTGWSRHEATGQPMARVFHVIGSVSQLPIADPARVAVDSDRSVHIPPDSILIRRDGCEIPIEDSVAPIHDRQGNATGASHRVSVMWSMASTVVAGFSHTQPNTIFSPACPTACCSTTG
ncbi:MAG: response regulator [Hyphomonadaceae bacterium]|nr:response regulator [Hyphomonadaceae bacterium]